MPALNYTTKVPVVRTMAEMQAVLAKGGATSVSTIYADGQPAGMAFTLPTAAAGPREFRLPVDVAAVQALLTSQRAKHGARVDARPEQAERVAWRIVKDWLEAQMALVEARMASLDEVMLPYLTVDSSGRSLREQWRDHAALPAGPDG